MLLAAAVVAAIGTALILRAYVAGRGKKISLGRMSDQWLAEQRTSRLP
jgi:hypothetical protein